MLFRTIYETPCGPDNKPDQFSTKVYLFLSALDFQYFQSLNQIVPNALLLFPKESEQNPEVAREYLAYASFNEQIQFISPIRIEEKFICQRNFSGELNLTYEDGTIPLWDKIIKAAFKENRFFVTSKIDRYLADIINFENNFKADCLKKNNPHKYVFSVLEEIISRLNLIYSPVSFSYKLNLVKLANFIFQNYPRVVNLVDINFSLVNFFLEGMSAFPRDSQTRYFRMLTDENDILVHHQFIKTIINRLPNKINSLIINPLSHLTTPGKHFYLSAEQLVEVCKIKIKNFQKIENNDAKVTRIAELLRVVERQENPELINYICGIDFTTLNRRDNLSLVQIIAAKENIKEYHYKIIEMIFSALNFELSIQTAKNIFPGPLVDALLLPKIKEMPLVFKSIIDFFQRSNENSHLAVRMEELKNNMFDAFFTGENVTPHIIKLKALFQIIKKFKLLSVDKIVRLEAVIAEIEEDEFRNVNVFLKVINDNPKKREKLKDNIFKYIFICILFSNDQIDDDVRYVYLSNIDFAEHLSYFSQRSLIENLINRFNNGEIKVLKYIELIFKYLDLANFSLPNEFFGTAFSLPNVESTTLWQPLLKEYKEKSMAVKMPKLLNYKFFQIFENLNLKNNFKDQDLLIKNLQRVIHILKKHQLMISEVIDEYEYLITNLDPNMFKDMDSFIETIIQNPAKFIPFKKMYTTLSTLELWDNGHSQSNWQAFAEKIVTKIPAPRHLVRRAISDEKDSVTIKSANICELIQLYNLRLDKILGRTIIFVDANNNYYAIKIKKKNENENDLIKEFTATKYLCRQQKDLNLISQLPEPLGVFVISGIKSFIERAQLDTSSLDKLIIFNEELTCYFYKADANYFKYLHDKDLTLAEFALGNRRAIHDLSILLGHGIIYPQLADIFHNSEEKAHERDDAGRYLVLVDLLRRNMHGSGRLTGWQKAVEYPNLRASGIADLGDGEGLFSIMQYGKLTKKFFTEAKIKFNNKVGNLLIGNTLAEYLYILFLIAGSYARKKEIFIYTREERDKLWKNIAHILIENIAYMVSIFTPHSEEQLKKLFFIIADVDRLATQMHFWMTENYIMAVKNVEKFPQNLYSKDTDFTCDFMKFRFGTFNSDVGFSINGKDQDLGPVNGQEPIKEYNKLLYWMFGVIGSSYLSFSNNYKTALINNIKKSLPITKESKDEKNSDRLNSTFKNMREDFAARSIQRFFRVKRTKDGALNTVKALVPG